MKPSVAVESKRGAVRQLVGHFRTANLRVFGTTNNPWKKSSHTSNWANIWGCDFANTGALVHINAVSGLGDWPFGFAQLQHLLNTVHQAALLKIWAVRNSD